MDFDEVMAALEAAGTEQNRKVFPRHGAKEPLFGVSYAVLGKLAKKIETDHELALALWDSGVHDARVLATKVVDPDAFTARQADAWVRDCDNYVLVEAIAAPVARSPIGAKRAAVWRGRKGEWPASAGWAVTAHHAIDPDGMDDDTAIALLDEIEATIAGKPNRVRHEMNGALIAIGLRTDELRAKALAVAEAIGPVTVDHGQTGCKTPDATAYIDKAVASGRVGRQQRKKH